MKTQRSNPEGWRSYGPGKFDSMVDSFLYSATLEGWGDEETGDVEGPGAYTLIVGSILEAAEAGAKNENETLTEAERDELKDDRAVILREDSQGFVSVDYYESEADARHDWKEIEEDVAGFYEEDEGEEDGEDESGG